ncbi:UDP-2,3-diacylglucosamine diphosphatase [Gammaproteobacteria bacterium]|nr:UDP-2,3-diacylglucosamine diphosphatase [Gammaproteobacteria bacterium]MDC0387502.1 UDP-2,3-diacylglucosamine diphosphatase [Gammaproteobacteria bacterium]
MKLGFISDLHLSKNTPSVTEGFFKFLQTAAQELSHLYILGDLFEAWVGDDDNSELATSVIQKINHATRNGLEIFFIHGNRDFLCGESFAEHSNLTLLPDPFFLNFFDLKIALSHGDDFCTEDLEYIEFKKEVRSSKWQEEFLQKPLDERLSIASNMRDASQKNNSSKEVSIMDVTQAAIEDFFEEHHIDLLIHGHTHRPKTHKTNTSTRIVLGDWHETGWCLMLDEQQQELKEFIL